MRIVVADDHPLMVDGIEALLATEGDLEVVGRATDGEETLAVIEETGPDLVLLDLRMPGLEGLDVLARLADRETPPKVVVLAAEVSGPDALEAVRLGARGLVLKAEAPRRLLDCIRAVQAGERWIDPSTFGGLLDAALEKEARAAKVAGQLTEREREVVELVAEGLSNRSVARTLGIGEGTVKTHLYNIFQKLGVDNRTQLTVLVSEHDLV